MKSYYRHLETTGVVQSSSPVSKRPVYRSSAIFPVVHSHQFSSRISFLGYWLLKRGIQELAILLTLRNQNGEVLDRRSMTIDTGKSFVIELLPLLQEQPFYNASEIFYGSLEIEIFSTRDLHFPYPAVIVCYYNENFSTAVHSAGRIYNDFEDLRENDSIKVPESGFDIFPGVDFDPFISFTNGALPAPKPSLEYTLVNHAGRPLEGSIPLPTIDPYETIFLFLKKHIPLDAWLEGEVGTIKLRHPFRGFFPRFFAGNLQHSFPSISLTHTYYDCSTLSNETDYWKRTDERFNDASIFVPLFLENDYYTEVIFYPIYSPSVFTLALSFFDLNGKCIKQIPSFKQIDTRKTVFERISVKAIVQDHGLDPRWAKGLNIEQNAFPGHLYPTRIKMGLNVGTKGRPIKLPCNICFNAQVGNPATVQKPRSFRWAPFLNVGTSIIVLTNSAPLKNYEQKADVQLQFFRERDGKMIERKVEIPPFGQTRIELDKEPELKLFLAEKTGWMTALSDNPYVNGWYFDFHKSGAVAGDHCF